MKTTKRIIDILVSLLMIIFSIPIIIVAAIAIKIDSSGPVFYAKKSNGETVRRVGKNGKTFRYFKLRTMIINSDDCDYEALRGKAGSDSNWHVTRIGKFLRKHHIDELPEFIFVLNGDMSLIGPRPVMPEYFTKYPENEIGYQNIKPGITGLAQITRGAPHSHHHLNLFYQKKLRPKLELMIILKTVLLVIKK